MARVNLIRSRHREARASRIAVAWRQPSPELVLGMVALILLAGSIVAYVGERRSLSEARAAVVEAEADSARFEGAVERVRQLERAQARLEARIELLEGVVDGRLYWLRFMETLSRVLPAYVWLERLDRQDVGPEEIRVVGASFANAAITDLMRELEASPEVRGVRLVEVSRSRRDSLDVQQFTLVAGLEAYRTFRVPDTTASPARLEIEPAEESGEGGKR